MAQLAMSGDPGIRGCSPVHPVGAREVRENTPTILLNELRTLEPRKKQWALAKTARSMLAEEHDEQLQHFQSLPSQGEMSYGRANHHSCGYVPSRASHLSLCPSH